MVGRDKDVVGRPKKRGTRQRTDMLRFISAELLRRDPTNAKLFQRPSKEIALEMGVTPRRVQQLRKSAAYIALAGMKRKDRADKAERRKVKATRRIGDEKIDDIGYIELGRFIKAAWKAEGSKLPIKNILASDPPSFDNVDGYIEYLWKHRHGLAISLPRTK